MLHACTVILVDDGLLRTSTGCACVLFSLNVYINSVKPTLMATTPIIYDTAKATKNYHLQSLSNMVTLV